MKWRHNNAEGGVQTKSVACHDSFDLEIYGLWYQLNRRLAGEQGGMLSKRNSSIIPQKLVETRKKLLEDHVGLIKF